MLSKSEFNVLYYIKNIQSDNVTQRLLSEKLGISLGKVNRVMKELISKQLLEIIEDGCYRLTENCEEALLPYKVKNAVIMAAGMSNRFVPLSYEKPKGLLVVNGEVLIEREIRQLQESGITDITVVVGYMKEKFFYLEEKFGVKIVVNEDYYRYNNTSTLMRVKGLLSNTYICSSDNYFIDNVFEPYVYQAYYSAVYTAGETEEYCLECNNQGQIKKVTIGGQNSWYMLGHVYFDKTFSNKFIEILQKEYNNPETKEQLWENLYMRYINELDMYIRKYDSDKVFEFDSLNDLRKFDSNYINNTDSAIMKNICNVLSCEMKDIIGIEAIKSGLTNTSFRFTVKDKEYVYRHPGRGTEKYINRRSEAVSMKVATELGLDNTFIYMDSEQGWKISRYIENTHELDYHNPAEVSQAIRLMRKLHNSRRVSPYDFNIWLKIENYIENLKGTGKIDFEDFYILYDNMKKIYKKVIEDDVSIKCLCHCDSFSPNFLVDENGKMNLIDWEYSGNDDPASDIGIFICGSDYTYAETVDIINCYLEHPASNEELKHYIGYIAIASYYCYVWALYQEARGNIIGEWLYLWYKNSKFYMKKLFEL